MTVFWHSEVNQWPNFIWGHFVSNDTSMSVVNVGRLLMPFPKGETVWSLRMPNSLGTMKQLGEIVLVPQFKIVAIGSQKHDKADDISLVGGSRWDDIWLYWAGREKRMLNSIKDIGTRAWLIDHFGCTSIFQPKVIPVRITDPFQCLYLDCQKNGRTDINQNILGIFGRVDHWLTLQ